MIGDVPWGTHFCCFYETKQDLLDTLVPYFKAGLESKEFCLWVVAQAMSVEEAKQALGQAVPDLERHLSEGTLEIHQHDEWYLRHGRWDPERVLQSWREKLNPTSAKGYAGLRAAGDGGWIQNDEWMVFSEYERRVTGMLAGQQSIILCTYPLTTSPGAQVFDVAHIHQVAVARRKGRWEMIELPELRQAKAEIERLNEVLEQKVEERTRELAAANEALRSEIAERKLAEAAVKQAEDRIRLVIDTIPTMAWSLRPDGILDFINQRWLDYAGLSFEEAIAEPTRTMHPEDLSKVMEKWRKDMAAGEPYEGEVRLRRADGEYRWFLIRTVPLLDGQGNIVKWYGTSADIEDRKRAETQWRVLIDAIPHEIWSGPPDGSLDYCNERWRSYTGLEMEDAGGDRWQMMLHPEDRDRVLKAWQESVVQGTPYQQEERHRGADGTYRWFLSRGVPLRDAAGRITRWYGTNTDIEDRKRAETTLRHREEYLRVLLEHVPVGVYTCNQEGLIEYYNPRAAEIWGRAPVIRDPMQRYCGSLALYYTDGTPMPFEENIMAQVVSTGIPQGNQEVVIGRPDGTKLIALINVAPLRNERGEIIGAVNCMLDISGRKQAEDALRESEARSRLLIKSSNIGFWDWNLVTHEVFYSPEWKSQLGYADDEISDRYEEWESRLHPEDREPSLRAVEDFREGRREDYDIEFRLRHKDGSWRSILTRADLIRDAAGQPVRIMGCHIDFTERKQAEQQVAHFAELFQALSHRLLEVQEEERRHLARELHDEIGQALTAAKLNLKIIAPSVPPAIAGRLEDSAQILDRLLMQVRELSLDLRPPLLDDLGLVPALRWLADQQARRTGLRITLAFNVDGLEMDPPLQTACFRVVQEAITNAIRHARAAMVTVELQAEPERVWLVVQDDGAGFDQAAVQQRAAHGASVGLLSMHERVALLGGGLEVNSAPGRGTEIRAWFPLAGAPPNPTA